MKAKAINEALVEKQAIVENNRLGKRLDKVEAKATVVDRLVAVEVDTLADKRSMVKTVALANTVAHRVIEVDVQTLCFTLAKVDAERHIYALAGKLRVGGEEKFSTRLPR